MLSCVVDFDDQICGCLRAGVGASVECKGDVSEKAMRFRNRERGSLSGAPPFHLLCPLQEIKMTSGSTARPVTFSILRDYFFSVRT